MADAALEKDGAAPDSTPALRMLGVADDYLKVVKNPAICPMPAHLVERGDANCMSSANAGNPGLVEQRKKLYTEFLRDATRDLDLMRGFYSAYGKAF